LVRSHTYNKRGLHAWIPDADFGGRRSGVSRLQPVQVAGRCVELKRSEDRAQSALDKSYEKISDQEIKFNNDAAHQTYNVAIAKADGNRKVALATCESQSGDAQKACKEQAEADYRTARSDARASATVAVEHK
jgi:hypothetical protein